MSKDGLEKDKKAEKKKQCKRVWHLVLWGKKICKVLNQLTFEF